MNQFKSKISTKLNNIETNEANPNFSTNLINPKNSLNKEYQES